MHRELKSITEKMVRKQSKVKQVTKKEDDTDDRDVVVVDGVNACKLEV